MRRAPIVVFGVLVAATFAAFFVAQRLKNAPSVVQQFNAYYVFSPNGDGRLDRARVTFKVKKADDVTVEMVDSDGDPVKTLLDDRHLDAYAPIKPALRWDGTDDDGKAVPDGRYRVRITLRHLGRSVFPQRSILKDTKPPQPKVLSIGPTKVYGPELLPEPEGGKAEVHFGPALGAAREDPRLPDGAGRAARGPDRPAARGPDPVGLGRHRRRRAARLAGDLRRRPRVARRRRQHRHGRAAGPQGPADPDPRHACPAAAA